MITYPLTFPAWLGVNRIMPVARQIVGQSTSPFTGSQQTYVYDAQWWEYSLSTNPLPRALGRQAVAFFTSLNGTQGTFTMRAHDYLGAQGSLAGTPLVAGASQVGNTLHTDGWTPSQTGVLMPGDMFQLGTGVNSRLHMVVQQVDSNGSGAALIEIWPLLRGSPADNAALILSDPVGIWRLTDGGFSHTISLDGFYEIDFAVREALDG